MILDEHSRRHWYLISYDIRDPKRWRLTYKELRGRGQRAQYSLFRCHLTRTEMESLRWTLERILTQEDDLLVIHLCGRCAGGIEERGKQASWNDPLPRFTIL